MKQESKIIRGLLLFILLVGLGCSTHTNPPTAIRALWIPAPNHTKFFNDYKTMVNAIERAKKLKFNTLYVVAYADRKTLFPSKTFLENTSYTDMDSTLMTPHYKGKTNDFLTDIIYEAHKRDMKVILWFEYGFMAQWGEEPTPENNVILAKHPEWASKGNNGITANHNNTDFYLNSFLPATQKFLLGMIMEAVNNYDIDGIQGDDRLPACPVNSGYDSYTTQKYAKEHNGQKPPQNFKDSAWKRWRADILNAFGKQLYQKVKKAKPNCLVCFSPNPYPWAYDVLLQDFPTWLQTDMVDVLSVQCYRKEIESYKATVSEVKKCFDENNKSNAVLNPGVLLQLGKNIATNTTLLTEQIEYNQQINTNGETYFFFDGIYADSIANVFKKVYKREVSFPKME